MNFSYSDYIRYFENDGFLIPKLELEIPLYRYRGKLKNIIDEIENDHIFLSPLENLNDPFDSSCSISFEEACQMKKPANLFYWRSYFLHRFSWYDELGSYIDEARNDDITLAEFSKIVSSFANSKGDFISAKCISKIYYEFCFGCPVQRKSFGKVASFSETWESIPMWSYYANSHKGVCLKYEFDILDSNNVNYRNILASLNKVWYSEQRFRDLNGAFTPFIKSLQWAHEQEWRLFTESKEKYLFVPCLTEIYLGIDFNFHNIGRIIKAINKNGRKIKVYQVYNKADKYSLGCIPIKIN